MGIRARKTGLLICCTHAMNGVGNHLVSAIVTGFGVEGTVSRFENTDPSQKHGSFSFPPCKNLVSRSSILFSTPSTPNLCDYNLRYTPHEAVKGSILNANFNKLNNMGMHILLLHSTCIRMPLSLNLSYYLYFECPVQYIEQYEHAHYLVHY